MPVAGAISLRERLDRYQLVERIGRGGMAEVFRARVQSLGGFERDVAIKVLLPQFASESEFVDMLLDEARIAGAIVHPCVVQVLDVGRQGEVFYLVMEYVCGTDLRSIARTIPGAKLPLAMALYIVGEVLRGLHAVHLAVDDQGRPRKIVHRDVSPANVLIDENGTVKLGDFGIAHASGRLTRTRTGSIKGKSRYMAPEQLTGQPVDHRADLYAVGVTLFEALLGDVARESSYATPYGPMFTWPRRMPPELIPSDVAEILRRAVVDDPRQRFADAAQFRRVIVSALQRHAPGYDAEVLARDLRRLRGELVDDGGDFSESTDAATELRGESARRLKLVDRSPAPPPLVPAPAMRTQTLPPPEPLYADADVMRPTMPYRPSVPSSSFLLPQSGRKLLLAVAGAFASAALIAIIIALASGSSVPPLPRLDGATVPPPRAMPLPPPRATTGILSVAGPVGARVIIGAVVYPPAPCAIELPPGNYDVKLRMRRRLVVRHVTVDAGRTTAL
ncbi:MAG: serine/threonine protein kinase [Myxococcales bacterium]|nr:serine/threonine protein kinase [Myxococcales bacterium]